MTLKIKDVKKGLKCCSKFPYKCDKCPYRAETINNMVVCMETLHKHALVIVAWLDKQIEGVKPKPD